MSDEQYLDARFSLEKGDRSDWSEKEIDDFLDEFLEFIENRDMFAGGCFGPFDSDKECRHCDGSGLKAVVNEEDRCETCDGSGRKTEEEPATDPEAEQEWKDLYAPVAQQEECRPPKSDVEGSSPSGSATFERDKDS